MKYANFALLNSAKTYIIVGTNQKATPFLQIYLHNPNKSITFAPVLNIMLGSISAVIARRIYSFIFLIIMG